MSERDIHFDFNQEYVLENEVVRLEPLRLDHFENLEKFSLYEPELWTYSLIPANGSENLKRYIETALKGRSSGLAYPFAVIDKRREEYAGSTRFYDVQLHHKMVQLGYTWYGRDFQGTGLNKNCKLLLLEFAFEGIGFERVEFRADNLNDRSIAAMMSIGCVVEGVLRSNCQGVNGRRDSIVLSILKDEWFSHVRQNLLDKIS